MRSLNTDEEQRAWRLGSILTDEVREQGRGKLGAHLGTLLRLHDATFLTDTGLKLRELLDAYAPELTVVGRAGHDLVWGLGLEEDAPDIDPHEALLDREHGDDETAHDIEWLSAEFHNYRSLRDTSLTLDPLTVLVGRNAAGKSNVLDGLFRASLMTRRKPGVVFTGAHSAPRVTGRWAPSAGFTIIVHGSKAWGFEYSRNDPSEPETHRPFTMQTDGGQRTLSSLLFTPMGAAFGGATYLRLDASKLQRPTCPPREQPFLRHDGLYLPSVLAHVVQTDRERFETIIDGVRSLVPSVEDLRTPWEEMSDSDGRVVIANRLEVKMRGVGWIPADQLSEGTLLVLGLLTILSRPHAPRLLLLDDVDRGLHPSAQRRLVTRLMEFATTTTKIVCTSHSPYVLDPLPVSAIRVVVADPDTGATAIHELADHPEWGKWSQTMTPADFWQYIGDEAWPKVSV